MWIFLTEMEFETDRLFLRQWLPSDREPFAKLNADSRVMAFFPQPLSRVSSDAMADKCQARIAENGWGFWAVELKETGQFIGFVGLNTPTAELPFSPCVEIGWRLAFEYWGKGLASEAARAALRVGFEELGLSEIVSFTVVKNLKSRAVMERLHMVPSDEVFEHPQVPIGSPIRLHCLYRLSRERWATHQ